MPQVMRKGFKDRLVNVLGMGSVPLGVIFLSLYLYPFPIVLPFPTGPTCAAAAYPGIQVEVIDAATGEWIEDVEGFAVDGSYKEQLRGDQGRLMGAVERPGKYVISVNSPGYHQWISRQIRVTRTGGFWSCRFLKSANLQVKLIRDDLNEESHRTATVRP